MNNLLELEEWLYNDFYFKLINNKWDDRVSVGALDIVCIYNGWCLSLEDLEPQIHNSVDLSSENEIFALAKSVPVEIFTFFLLEIRSL